MNHSSSSNKRSYNPAEFGDLFSCNSPSSGLSSKLPNQSRDSEKQSVQPQGSKSQPQDSTSQPLIGLNGLDQFKTSRNLDADFFSKDDSLLEVSNTHTQNKPLYDTHQITQIYLQRPLDLSLLSLGQWFCRAHCLKDHDLINSSGSESKTRILDRGYNALSLEPLLAYNAAWRDKENKLPKISSPRSPTK